MSTQSPSLFIENSALKVEVEGLRFLVKNHQEREKRFEAELEWFKEQLTKLTRERFGPRKERWESEEQGILLFNEAEVEALKPESADSEGENEEEVEVSGFKRKRGKRRPLPENLPREVVVLELPENEKITEDGQPLKVIGKVVTEKFFFEPAQMKVIEYHRYRYGVDSGDPIKTAPMVPSIIPKGIVTPSLLAHIVIQKYADGLPLYRQEEIWERQGVHLTRGSMARWIIQAAQACLPIWNILEEWLLDSSYVSCDETHIQVLKEEGRKAETQSWMWARATPNRRQPIVLFDYDPHRSAEVAKKLLQTCRGYLQADGYGAYNWAEKAEGIVRIGCNMHGRRGFSDANKGAQAGRGLAAQGLKYYKLLYDIEEKAKKKGLSPPERKALRDAEAVPIWDEMKSWADGQICKVPKKSYIGKGLNYFLEEYQFLRGYLLDGNLEIDNGYVERSIRKFGIGRNNWMFSDTPEGADASALLYSLVVTAKLNGVNPYQALRTIFERIPTATTVEDYEVLAKFLLSPDTLL